MSKIFITGLIMLSAFQLRSQTMQKPVATAHMSTSCYGKIQMDAFSFKCNQAALASIKNLSIGIYGERRFMLKELSLYSLAFVLPSTSGNFGFSGDYFGNMDFNQSSIGLSYGRKMGKTDLGLQFNYQGSKISTYGKESTVNIEGGFIYHLTEKLRTGVHIYNPICYLMKCCDEPELKNENESSSLPAVADY